MSQARPLPDGSGEQPTLCLDAVRCTLIRLEFVIPDAYDEESGLPAADAGAVPTDFVGVSDPRPTVILDEVSSSQVTVGGDTAIVVLTGTVRDPIADNVPRGKVSEGLADIDSVQVYVDGEAYGDPVPLSSHDDGPATFWRQHPYKATFRPLIVHIPLEEGTHVVRVETSENAAGNTGFDEVAVTLEKREIPGTGAFEADTFGPAPILNLHLPQAPAPDQADSLQYYRGDRDPTPDDPTLTETQADSLAFAGTINGLQTEVTLLNFAGLTAEADTLTARITYTLSGAETSQDLTFTETGGETGVFRFCFADPSPETLEVNVYLPISPTAEVSDSLQYYYGIRPPLPDDAVLSEAAEGLASLVFEGTFADGEATVCIDRASFAGLTQNVDSLYAIIDQTLYDGANTAIRLTFTETAAASRLFTAAHVLEEPMLPEMAVEGIYFPAGLSANAADTLITFSGEGNPGPDADALTETADDSLEFEARYEGASVFVTVSGLQGLTDGIDSLEAAISRSVPGGGTWYCQGSFTETGPTTRLFRGSFPLNGVAARFGPTVWCSNVEGLSGTPPGWYTPANIGVKGLPSGGSWTVALLGSEFPIETDAGTGYAQCGGSLAHHVRWLKNGDPDTIIILMR